MRLRRNRLAQFCRLFRHPGRIYGCNRRPERDSRARTCIDDRYQPRQHDHHRIVVTTLVFSLTDFGGAREDLARRMLHVSQEIMSALIQALRYQAGSIESSRAIRRALLAEVAGLDAIIMRLLANPSLCAPVPRSSGGLIWIVFRHVLLAHHRIASRRTPEARDRDCRRISPLGTAGRGPFQRLAG